MKTSAISPLVALALLSGCREESEVWVETAGPIDRAIEVQIAVRSQPYRPGDGINEGDFRVVSSNVFPIRSTGGAGNVVSNYDGVVMEMQWDNVRQLQSRIDQHHSFETQIAFDNFRLAVKNELIRPDGVAHRLGSFRTDSKGLSTEFDLMVSPITFSSGTGENEHALVIRARLLPQTEPAKPLTIPEMPGVAIDDAGN